MLEPFIPIEFRRFPRILHNPTISNCSKLYHLNVLTGYSKNSKTQLVRHPLKISRRFSLLRRKLANKCNIGHCSFSNCSHTTGGFRFAESAPIAGLISGGNGAPRRTGVRIEAGNLLRAQLFHFSSPNWPLFFYYVRVFGTTLICSFRYSTFAATVALVIGEEDSWFLIDFLFQKLIHFWLLVGDYSSLFCVLNKHLPGNFEQKTLVCRKIILER